MWKIVGVGDAMKEEDMEETKMLWEKTFDQPYEKAGGAAITRPIVEPPFYWDVTNTDVNTKYKSLVPRFLFEVCSLLVLSISICRRYFQKQKPASQILSRTI